MTITKGQAAFLTDTELSALAQALEVDVEELLQA